ncbi:MAG TPA: MMPL family transporter, partial [Stellaceae bacterium]|nr:MMPL family transporter [Stellaceae bacterium]
VQGQTSFFSWQNLLDHAEPRDRRQILLVQPKLDTTGLSPGARASAMIRGEAAAFSPGVTTRLTGSVLLADEEFASLGERAGPICLCMVLAALLVLWLGLRSWRIIAAILATTLCGLAVTAGLGLALVGRFNLISVAFIPLFVGLGIDFAIQFSMRFQFEYFREPSLETALRAAGTKMGVALALAAAAMAVGFFAFLPTSYVGASELGLIAGLGMIVAFFFSITFLPAFLAWVRPRRPAAVPPLGPLARIKRSLRRHRRTVLGVAAGAALAALFLLPGVRFDFDPLHLKNPASESVSTLKTLEADRDRTPDAIEALAPSVAAAERLARRFGTVPEVAKTVFVKSFIPEQQREKLALIADTASLIDLTLHPIDHPPPPSDTELIAALREGAADLRSNAPRLAATLEALATGTPALRADASAVVVTPLNLLLERLRAAFHPAPVTLADLPAELRRDWVAADGSARLQIYPAQTAATERFTREVEAMAPQSTGAPIITRDAAHLIIDAFAEAGVWSLLAIALLLALVLRRLRDVAWILLPTGLTGLLSAATLVVIGLPLNFANIIALPLLFGIGVAFNIYVVMAWRRAEPGVLSGNLARALMTSALTTLSAFASLLLSTHPGTASLGLLLAISLAWTLAIALLFVPALLEKF